MKLTLMLRQVSVKPIYIQIFLIFIQYVHVSINYILYNPNLSMILTNNSRAIRYDDKITISKCQNSGKILTSIFII